MTWKRFGLSMIFPVSFTLALYSHLRRPWLPAVVGDLPYREAVAVAFMVWSFYVYASNRAVHGRKRVVCERCRESFRLAQWHKRGVCPACLHTGYEAPPAPTPEPVRQAPAVDPFSLGGKRVSVTELTTPRLSSDEKQRVQKRLDRVLASVGPNGERAEP